MSGGLRLWGFPEAKELKENPILSKPEAKNRLREATKGMFHKSDEKGSFDYHSMEHFEMALVGPEIIKVLKPMQGFSQQSQRRDPFGFIHLHNALEVLYGNCACREASLKVRQIFSTNQAVYNQINQYLHDKWDPAYVAPGRFQPLCGICEENKYHFTPRVKEYGRHPYAARICGRCGNHTEWKFKGFVTKMPPRVCTFIHGGRVLGDEQRELDFSPATYLLGGRNEEVYKTDITQGRRVCEYRTMGPTKDDDV